MATSVLITGASGLVGSRLTELLTQKGYRVSHLGRIKK
ncbi:MAG TPA: NAD-dependent epimerase/dehydratase family protein, partial [Cyclobacteriaceae bacterium]|nr:NAD-dependent epimerase/dehydratase family protein [Cyclobacteriaceae bacterium]